MVFFLQSTGNLNGQDLDWANTDRDSERKNDMDIALALKQTVESSSEA